MRRLLDVDPRAVSFLYFAAGSIITLSFAPLGCHGLAPVLTLPLLTACLWSPPRRASSWQGSDGCSDRAGCDGFLRSAASVKDRKNAEEPMP